jgi:HAMP domain-containing protein
MRTSQMRHPEAEQLLRYADGESPARSAGQIRSHLEACWECRAELEDLQSAIGECVHYRRNTLQRHLPAPPAPWADIYDQFAKIDAAFERDSFRERVMWVLRTPFRSTKKWAPVAVALIAACTLFYWFRQTPSVQAAELLRRAIAAADSRPQRPRPIQIRTKTRRLTRITGAERKVTLNAADTDTVSSLQALFQAAHYDWKDPLSAKSYQEWRDRLKDKRDEVVEEQDAYSIRTNTGSGELMEATLKIRRRDLLPVAGRLEFRDQEWVEITEIAEEATQAPDPIASAGRNRADHQSNALPRILPNGRPPSSISTSATIGDELHVLATLREMNADLGDPIEVSQVSGDILVTGVGVPTQRQQEIKTALSSHKHVVIRFFEPTQETVQPEREASADTTTAANVQQLQTRIARQIGGRVYFTQLAAQVLDLSEPMMARAYALRRLAERIPIEVEPELSTEERGIVRRLQRDHTEALGRQIAEIDRILKPVLASVGGASETGQPGVTSSGAWQSATEELFQTARRVDRLLAVMFGAAVGESSGEQIPSQLLSSLVQLRGKLEVYDRLSTQALERRE